jgi:hypothetical protein
VQRSSCRDRPGHRALHQRAAASGDVVQWRVFQEPKLFSDVQFFGAQFGEVALFAIDLILLEVEVSR